MDDEVLYAWVVGGQVGNLWAPALRTVGDCVSEISGKQKGGCCPLKFEQDSWFPLGLLPVPIGGQAALSLEGRRSTYHSFCPVYDQRGELIAVLLRRTPTDVERRQARG